MIWQIFNQYRKYPLISHTKHFGWPTLLIWIICSSYGSDFDKVSLMLRILENYATFLCETFPPSMMTDWQRITTTFTIDGCIQKSSCTIESYCFPEYFWPSNWSRSTLFRAFFSPIIGFGRGLVATTFHRASSHAAERGKCPRHQCINVVETLLYSSLVY